MKKLGFLIVLLFVGLIASSQKYLSKIQRAYNNFPDDSTFSLTKRTVGITISPLTIIFSENGVFKTAYIEGFNKKIQGKGISLITYIATFEDESVVVGYTIFKEEIISVGLLRGNRFIMFIIKENP